MLEKKIKKITITIIIFFIIFILQVHRYYYVPINDYIMLSFNVYDNHL